MKNSACSYLITLMLILTLTSVGCSFTKVPYTDPRCKIQAHIDQVLLDYLSKRYQKGSTPRIAVMPFDVPANFSPVLNPELQYGNNLAMLFQQKILEKNLNVIVEIFDRKEWPGKSQDFFTGNTFALKQARDAGYDLLLVGKFESIVDRESMSIKSKIIDTENSTTVWYGTVSSISPEIPTKSLLNFLSRGQYPLREDVMHFSERADKTVECSVNQILSDHVDDNRSKYWISEDLF